MVLKYLVDSLARQRSGAFMLLGVAAVLTGVERLMISPGKRRTSSNQSARSLVSHRESRESARGALDTTSALPVFPRRTDFFSIKQTKSDLGYTYWVLQGHGRLTSFELFDTWPEAVSAAEMRLSNAKMTFNQL